MAGNNLRLFDKKCSLRSQVCDLRLFTDTDTDVKLNKCLTTVPRQSRSLQYWAPRPVALIKILKVLIKLYGLEGFTLENHFSLLALARISVYVSARIFVSTVFGGRNNVSIDMWMIQFYQLGGMQAASHIFVWNPTNLWRIPWAEISPQLRSFRRRRIC